MSSRRTPCDASMRRAMPHTRRTFPSTPSRRFHPRQSNSVSSHFDTDPSHVCILLCPDPVVMDRCTPARLTSMTLSTIKGSMCSSSAMIFT